MLIVAFISIRCRFFQRKYARHFGIKAILQLFYKTHNFDDVLTIGVTTMKLKSLPLALFALCFSSLSFANQAVNSVDVAAASQQADLTTDQVVQPEAEPPTGTALDLIPETIDKTPTILPEQSNHKIVPPTAATKSDSWWDRTQDKFSNSLQKRAHSINDWFGEPDPEEPAWATLRLIVDTEWDEYEDVSVKPRVRGKIKLPTLENKLSLVFGDDSLDNEIRNNVAISNENPRGDSDDVLDSQQTRDNNSSLALRWSQWKNPWGVDTDADLGVRSGDDIYARLKLEKDWDLNNNFSTHAEQIYRYGLDSKDYLRTNFEIRHARPNQAFLSDQLTLTYTDDGYEQNFNWDNRLYRQHQFFHDHWFNYGVYTGGDIDDNQPELDSYGPFLGWRQPFLREWLFVQAEVNYYNDEDLDRDHHVGALLRLETWFQ